MYAAGIMDHFSSTPKMELVVWGSTMALYASSAFRFRNQYRSARSTAGDIKPGSTGPRILTSVAILGQFCGSALPPLVYLTATAYNKFRQPEWMTEYALPSPPDVFGVDGVLVGRAVGLLAVLAGSVLTRAALKILGDQFHAIGIREKPRLVENGPFAYIRHPIYAQVSHSILTIYRTVPLTVPIHSGALISGASFALALWSYIPLYALPVMIGGYVLKVPIEEGTIVKDPELGNEYKLYKIKVPYRIIPYIW